MIKVGATLDLPLETVWIRWTTPKHIIHWNFATSDWQCLRAKNDLKKGGQFVYCMETKDGSTVLDFSGKYLSVNTNQQIEAVLDDGRVLTISIQNLGKQTKVTEVFEAEAMNLSPYKNKAGNRSLINSKIIVKQSRRQVI